MDLRLPKPIHGWRQLLGEVGIIVLGVLLALVAEQIAQAIHDRDTARDTLAEVSDELGDDLSSIALRGQAEPCIDRRLTELRGIFADWARTRRFTAPQWVAQAPTLDIALTRYEAALSAGRIALLPGEQQYRIGAVVAGIREFDRIQNDQMLVWGRLRALQAGPQALTSGDRTMLLTALQEASTLDYQAKLNVRQILPIAKKYGFAPDFERIRANAGEVWTSGRYTPSICTSIDTPRDEANKTQVVPLPF